MKLTALRLHNVRRFAGRGIAVEGIGDGVNVLFAANESGKSTCFDALHALFFQAHTGTPGAVQALRPYSGGNPLVEADIVTGEGAFRLTKQFYGGKRASVRELDSGRLLAQADEAERFIAGLVQGAKSGPAGLLWVRQGITGIETRAKKDEQEERRARESILTSVQDEVESLTGGRRMAQAMAACADELSRLVTATRRPKAGGPFAQALEERDQLREAEGQLAAVVQELREALDRRRKARRDLKALDDPEEQAARQREVEAAQAAFDAARAQAEALKTAEVRTALARTTRDAAQKAIENYRASLARSALLREKAAEGARAHEAARARQRSATDAGAEATAAVEAAEREENEARDLLDRLDKALKAREAAEKLAQLKTTHAQAEAERVKIEALGAELKARAVPVQALKQLEAQETRLVGLRAALSARVPVLRMDYAPGAQRSVTLDGVPLDDGAERPLTRSAALQIEGVGRLTVTLPEGAAGQDELAAAEQKQAALLASLGVASLEAARQREAAARDLSSQLDLARQRFALLAPDGLSPLQEAMARLEIESAGAMELKADPQAARAAHGAARMRVDDSRAEARRVQALREAAHGAFVEAERTLTGVTAELDALASALGPQEGRAAQEAGLAAAAARAEQDFAEAQAQEDGLRAGMSDVAGAEARLKRVRSIIDAASAERAKLREDLAGLDATIRSRSDAAVEEAWQETRDKLGAAEKRVASLEREVALLGRLQDALEAARTEARDHFFAPVMGELRPLLGLLFEDATVTFDEETLLPSTVCRNGVEEPVGVLSGGMREQLAILTRLAFARLLAKEGAPAPVILDDALVYSDDDRIERMFDALHRQARDQQIIVFSCRQRAFAQLGGNILHMAPWTPPA